MTAGLSCDHHNGRFSFTWLLKAMHFYQRTKCDGFKCQPGGPKDSQLSASTKSLSCAITLEAQLCETCFDCHHKGCKNTRAGNELTIMWILSKKIQCCLSPTRELMLFILGIGSCHSIGQLCIILSILMYFLSITFNHEMEHIWYSFKWVVVCNSMPI